MPRKLKTYQTSLGFYDLAIAAPSMKAALEAWGAGSNLFHQGVAKETDDPDVVAATMAKPGVVLRRPAGSSGRFAEHSGLPTDLGRGGGADRRERRRPKRRTPIAPRISDEEARKPPARSIRAARSDGREVAMKIRSHSESHLVELEDGSRWQIFPGDLDLTLGWTPETDLVVVEAAKDDVGSHLLVGVGEKVRVIPEGDSWPIREAKDVLKGG